MSEIGREEKGTYFLPPSQPRFLPVVIPVLVLIWLTQKLHTHTLTLLLPATHTVQYTNTECSNGHLHNITESKCTARVCLYKYYYRRGNPSDDGSVKTRPTNKHLTTKNYYNIIQRWAIYMYRCQCYVTHRILLCRREVADPQH